ncbi:MAG: pyridoxal phosphate-dependent aminotransferase [Candidatus Doudnabacteria bacterium]|jgi:aspartate aminotransferase
MKKLQVSQRGQNVIASPIRKFLPFLQATEAKGIRVFKLNVGDPDLVPPKEFFKVVQKYNPQSLGYAPSPGITAHMQAWQKYYKQFGVSVELNQMLPTVGCAEAIMLALQAVADFGDEIIVFEPLYASYKSFSVIAGIKLIPVTLPIEKNFAMPDVAEIEKKITARTKAIVIINPDNPTGKLWSDAEINNVIKLAKKHNLFIISDETYREIRFDGKKPVCLLTKKEAVDNMIVCDSVSKRFSMPGARIGCVISRNPEVMQSILKFAQARLSAGTLEQLGTVPLLNNSAPYVNKMVKEYQRRQKIVATGLQKIKGAIFKPAMGAFYQAVKLPIDDSEKFVKFMISEFSYKKQTVMVTPMKDFYISPNKGTQEIRIAYVLNVKDLEVAMDVLARGVEEYNSRG